MLRAVIYSFSRRGAILSAHIRDFLQDFGFTATAETMEKYANAAAGLGIMQPDHKTACGRAFQECALIVFVGAAGIAVRTIAPFIKSKTVDPAVLAVDERANFVIPLLSGHIGGANEFARALAERLGAAACVTTATDVNNLFAVDEWAARNNMLLGSMQAAKNFAAKLVGGEKAGLYSDFPVDGVLPRNVVLTMDNAENFGAGMAVTLDKSCRPFAETLLVMPRAVHLGIGCRRGTSLESIEALVLPALEKMRIDRRTIVGVASVDLKKDEQGLLDFAQKYGWPVSFYTAAALNSLEGDFTPSAFVQSVVGVSNVCERSAVLDSGKGALLMRKTSQNGVTLAAAVENIVLDFTKTGLRTE